MAAEDFFTDRAFAKMREYGLSKSDVLVAMTQPGYEKFIGSLKPGGTLIVDKDLVVTNDSLDPQGITKYSIAATDIAFRKT